LILGLIAIAIFLCVFRRLDLIEIIFETKGTEGSAIWPLQCIYLWCIANSWGRWVLWSY